MKKIKILQFPIANSNGGITHYAVNNWKWMNKERFQCDFATMSKKIDFEDELISMGSKIHYISCYAEDNLELFRQQVKKILLNNYDVVHLHTKQWKSFIMEELCMEYGVPKVIVHSHSAGIDTLDLNAREQEIELHERVKKEFNSSLATDFWACSYHAANFLFGDQISKEKIKIMNNAIELKKYSYNQLVRKQYRKEYELTDSFVLGCVARFEYVKNHMFLIEVFYKLLNYLPQAKLVLIGDGELRSSIEKMVKDLNISGKVLFMGKRTDVNCWYQVMDLFCLPSRFEGLPISVIEAQAAGLPCIVSDTITNEIKITPSVYMCSTETIEQWIEEIIGISNLTNDRVDNSNLLIEAGYSLEKQIKVLEREYLSESRGIE